MVGKKRGDAMINIMDIDGYRAVIKYDPEIDLFRGEFQGLNGGADFYAESVEALRREGKISLEVFLDICREKNIEPRKEYSGKFNLRLPPELHAEIAAKASADGLSLNQWTVEALDRVVRSEEAVG